MTKKEFKRFCKWIDTITKDVVGNVRIFNPGKEQIAYGFRYDGYYQVLIKTNLANEEITIQPRHIKGNRQTFHRKYIHSLDVYDYFMRKKLAVSIK